MRGAETVVLALGALGETGEPAALPQRPNPLAASGQNFVRVGLVSDVPDQPVVRRVEYVMQGDRQLDDAEACSEMATGYRDRADRLAAQLVGNFLKVFLVDAAQIGRRLDRIQNGHFRRHARDNIFPSSSTDIRGGSKSLPRVLLHRNEVIQGPDYRQQIRAIDQPRNLC